MNFWLLLPGRNPSRHDNQAAFESPFCLLLNGVSRRHANLSLWHSGSLQRPFVFGYINLLVLSNIVVWMLELDGVGVRVGTDCGVGVGHNNFLHANV